MVAPDVQIEDGKGTILISSEEGETESKEEGENRKQCIIHSDSSFRQKRALWQHLSISLQLTHILSRQEEIKKAFSISQKAYQLHGL